MRSNISYIFLLFPLAIILTISYLAIMQSTKSPKPTKKIRHVKRSLSLREDVATWLDRVSYLSHAGMFSRTVESLLMPAFLARHTDGKRSAS